MDLKWIHFILHSSVLLRTPRRIPNRFQHVRLGRKSTSGQKRIHGGKPKPTFKERHQGFLRIYSQSISEPHHKLHFSFLSTECCVFWSFLCLYCGRAFITLSVLSVCLSQIEALILQLRHDGKISDLDRHVSPFPVHSKSRMAAEARSAYLDFCSKLRFRSE